MKLVNFLADPDDYERWRHTAWVGGLKFSAWCRTVLNKEANSILAEDPVFDDDPDQDKGV